MLYNFGIFFGPENFKHLFFITLIYTPRNASRNFLFYHKFHIVKSLILVFFCVNTYYFSLYLTALAPPIFFYFARNLENLFHVFVCVFFEFIPFEVAVLGADLGDFLGEI